MNVAQYIVKFLERKKIDHVFGYQGTMIAYFVDAISESAVVHNHSCYNEQGAAFAACGYAKASEKTAVAYSTSGPGALNLISGVADAYYDSAPVLFITGQLNTTEYTSIPDLRQQGFQETDVISIFSPITKYSTRLDSAHNVAYELEKAWYIINNGRKGPVLIDIPMNIQRTEIIENELSQFLHKEIEKATEYNYEKKAVAEIISALEHANKPVLIIGNGIERSRRSKLKSIISNYKLPVMTSILGMDLVDGSDPHNMGNIGSAYGHRAANIIAYKKSDLIISLGCSLNRRQTGKPESFAVNAHIIRVDIDEFELKRKIHQRETTFNCDANVIIDLLSLEENSIRFDKWLKDCQLIKELTERFDNSYTARMPNKFITQISSRLNNSSIVVSDVGQHQMWISSSLVVRNNFRTVFSGGHGAMGFALPAAIGAFYATGMKTIVISGDGSFQMNIQELQWVFREQIPITIIVLNNQSLGLIRQQQDDFFGERHIGSDPEGGYLSPSFVNIGNAYKIESVRLESIDDFENIVPYLSQVDKPVLIEVCMPIDSKAYPKTFFGENMDNQRPYLPNDIINTINSL